MRTIGQAEKECYAAWAAQPDATHGWCLHHEVEFEELTEPIANRIRYIVNNKSRDEIQCRLDNLRPVSVASLVIILPAYEAYQKATAQAYEAYQKARAQAYEAYQKARAQAEEAYQKATAPAEEAYQKATAQAYEAYQKATAQAHRADVPSHTWNGASIFKN